MGTLLAKHVVGKLVILTLAYLSMTPFLGRFGLLAGSTAFDAASAVLLLITLGAINSWTYFEYNKQKAFIIPSRGSAPLSANKLPSALDCINECDVGAQGFMTDGRTSRLTNGNLPILHSAMHKSEQDGSRTARFSKMKRASTIPVVRVDDAALLTPQGLKKDDSQAPMHFDDEILARIQMRLAGWEHYSVAGALIAGFALSVISSVSHSDFDDVPWILSLMFVLTSALSTLAGLYTAIVFALCSLYGLSSIGMKKDEQYIKFISDTAVFRERGFIAFIAAPALLTASLSCMLFLKVPRLVASVVNVVALFFVWTTYFHIRSIVEIASEQIFNAQPKPILDEDN